MFTVDVANGDDTKVMIEAAWGLGEYVVQGIVTPDCYWVNKADLTVAKKDIVMQKIMWARKKGGGCEEQTVPLEKQVVNLHTNKKSVFYMMDKHFYPCHLCI